MSMKPMSALLAAATGVSLQSLTPLAFAHSARKWRRRSTGRGWRNDKPLTNAYRKNAPAVQKYCDQDAKPFSQQSLESRFHRLKQPIHFAGNFRAARAQLVREPGSNRVDRRTLEGQRLVEELVAFGEHVGPPIGDRGRLCPRLLDRLSDFRLGRRISLRREIRAPTDLVERRLSQSWMCFCSAANVEMGQQRT
jgi:hypothetical protein